MQKKTLNAEKSLEIYIYVCLAQQLEAYSYAFNGVLEREGKYRLHRFQHEAKMLMQILEKHADAEKLAQDAEVFDSALRKIREATGIQKMQLYDLMCAWTRGQVKVEEAPRTDFGEGELDEELMSDEEYGNDMRS